MKTSSTSPLIDSEVDPILQDSPSPPPSAIGRFGQAITNHVVATVSLTLFLSFAFIGGSSFRVWQIYQNSRKTVDQQFRLQELSKDTTYYDEALTMSASMAASTGDSKWADRYDSFVPKLDQTLAEITQEFPSAQAGFDLTKDATDQLYALEDEIFKQVRAGNPALAAQILFGEEYAASKATYAEGVDKTLAKLKEDIETSLAAYDKELSTSRNFALGSLLLLIVSWVIIVVSIRSYVKQRNQAQAKLIQSQESLREFNEALEERVTERTIQLEEQQAATKQQNNVLEEDIGILLDAVSAVEDGDLTIHAPVTDRVTGLVSDTFNRLVEEQAKIITVVLSTAEQVAAGAGNLEQVADSTVQQVQQQAQSVIDVKALIQGVNSLSEDNAHQAQAADDAVEEAQVALGQGQQAMSGLAKGINTLQQGTTQINRRVQTLTDFVQLAVQFAKDQKRVAAMTRVLSLNASLLSARASEQQDPEQFTSIAREFETVAAQVNDLALQTNQSLMVLQQRTDQIHTVVSGLNQDVDDINQLVTGFTSGVEQSHEVFDNIQTVTQRVAEVGQQVTRSSNEIVAAAQTTLESIQDISTLATETEQEATVTREQSDAMGQLAHNLLELVTFFRVPQLEASDDQPDSSDSSDSFDSFDSSASDPSEVPAVSPLDTIDPQLPALAGSENGVRPALVTT